MNRNEILLAGIDLRIARGIEIGALDKPIIPPETPGVFYVDHMGTEGLRAKYANDTFVVAENLVNVDGVWGDRTLAEITRGKAPFHFVVASHVIEHVPDLITWLRELDAVLGPRGEVRLAIPDRRHTFDYLRTETDVVDVLNAWISGARRPQSRCILDYSMHISPVDCGASWLPDFDPGALVRYHTPSAAIQIAKDAVADTAYHDVHCWVFTPLSFARLMAKLAECGCIEFKCNHFVDSPHNTFEFFVSLQKCGDTSDIVDSWNEMANTIRASSERAAADLDAQAAPTAAARQEEMEGLRRQEVDRRRTAFEAALAVQESAIRQLTSDRAQLEAALLSTRASTSWRVTAPLRAVAKALRRS